MYAACQAAEHRRAPDPELLDRELDVACDVAASQQVCPHRIEPHERITVRVRMVLDVALNSASRRRRRAPPSRLNASSHAPSSASPMHRHRLQSMQQLGDAIAAAAAHDQHDVARRTIAASQSAVASTEPGAAPASRAAASDRGREAAAE